METIHSALLLHKAGKSITEDAIAKILKAAGIKEDKNEIKKLVAALDGKDIDEILSKATMMAAAPSAAGGAAPEAAAAAEEEEEEEEEEETGISGLFD